MKIGIIQSNYLPWRGYIDFIGSVDIFVIYDDVQYSKNDWRNRNLIKTPRGLKWITVPIKYYFKQSIDATEIETSQNWVRHHLRLIEENYEHTPYCGAVLEGLSNLIKKDYRTISDLNRSVLNWVLKELEIVTPILNSRDLNIGGSRTERLINIVKKLGGTTYVSGPAAKAYLDVELFRKNGIALEYKSYDYPEYPQINGPFVGNVSIIDLLCNCGPKSLEYINSLTPNEVVIP